MMGLWILSGDGKTLQSAESHLDWFEVESFGGPATLWRYHLYNDKYPGGKPLYTGTVDECKAELRRIAERLKALELGVNQATPTASD